MKKDIDKIISECLANLFEAKIEASKDNVVKNAQTRVHDYMKNLVNKGDEKTKQIFTNKGYNNSLSKDEKKAKRKENFSNFNTTQVMHQDIIDTAKILKKYTNEKGGVNLEKLKQDYPDDYNTIIRIKHFIDLKGLTRMYDATANIPSHPYGIDWKNGGNIDDLNFNSISDAEARDYDDELPEEEAKLAMKQKIVDRYIDAKYGIRLVVPNIGFSNGNSKLPDNTLIVNFTSAIGCPAWNECLVKHACYARQVEKKAPSVYDGNENRSLFWLTTQHDDKLLTLMMDFARSYCFNYTKVAETLIKQGLVKGKMQAPNLAIKISKLDLTDSFFTPEIIKVMKQYRRIDYIRLNENGDFLGQWLVDAWDNEAGKYQPYGVNVSAYTCRHLNYEGIKNIIINTSFKDGKGNIARRFIALPEDVYDALDETYGGKNNQLIPNANNIKPFPQPLYNSDAQGNLTPNGKLYYKCPCERENGGDKVSCYQCSLCYQPKTDNHELFVFVKAHGTASGSLNGYDLIENNIGISRNFTANYEQIKIQKELAKQETRKTKKQANKKRKQKKGEPIMKNESISNSAALFKMASNEGINTVAKNAIFSVYNHFNNLGNMNESQVIKLSETELLSLIKEEIAKLSKN